jgi:hypothetical protein
MQSAISTRRLFVRVGYLLEHALTVAVGFVMMIVGLALGVTMIMLPVGIVIGLLGVLLVIGGLFAHIGES